MKKHGWRTNKNNFESYYLRQLKSFMKATNLFTDITHLTEDSSIDDISKTFDTLIDFLEVTNRNNKDYVVVRGVSTDSYKSPQTETSSNKMTKDLLNGIKIIVSVPDALNEEGFPVIVSIDSYGKIISKIKINNFSELKKIEDYWSQFNFPQYELIGKSLKDLGYN